MICIDILCYELRKRKTPRQLKERMRQHSTISSLTLPCSLILKLLTRFKTILKFLNYQCVFFRSYRILRLKIRLDFTYAPFYSWLAQFSFLPLAYHKLSLWGLRHQSNGKWIVSVSMVFWVVMIVCGPHFHPLTFQSEFMVAFKYSMDILFTVRR